MGMVCVRVREERGALTVDIPDKMASWTCRQRVHSAARVC